MSDQKKEPELLRKLKTRWGKIEGLLKTEPEPSGALKSLEKWVSEINSDEDERFEFFGDKVLLKAVRILSQRGDLKSSFAPRVAIFFVKATVYCVRFLSSDYEFAMNALDILFNPIKKPFYKTYGNTARETLDEPDVERVCNDEWAVSNYLLSCVNVFMKHGGDKIIVNRLVDKENKLTFGLVSKLTNIVWRIHDLLLNDLAKKFIPETLNAIFACMLNFGEDEVREMDRKSYVDLIDLFANILKRLHHIQGTENKAAEVIDDFRLNMARKCLKMQLLSQRFLGIDELCYYCKAVSKTDGIKIDIVSVNASFLSQWLLDNQIVEYIYKETSHEEIFRRSYDILSFLAIEHKIKPEQLDIIWASSLDKHESVTHQIWSTLGNLSQFLNSTCVDHIWEKVKVFPVANYDREYLRLVKQLTESGLCASVDVKRRGGSGTISQWYGVDLFWATLIDNPAVPVEIQNQAILELNEVMGWPLCRDQRLPLMLKCIGNLKDGNSVPQSLMVLRYVLASFDRDQYNNNEGERYTTQKVIVFLNNEHQLIPLFFTYLAKYCNNATTLKAPDGVTIDATVVTKNYTHIRYLTSLFDFIDFALTQSGITVTREQLDIMWESTVLKAVSDASREVALKWLENARNNSPQRPHPAVTEELTQYIFEEKIPTLNFRTMQLIAFFLFDYYFRYINWKKGRFEQFGDEYRVNSFDLIGMDTVWRLALETENAQVGEAAVTLLTRLQTSYVNKNSPEAYRQREAYLSKCLSYLQEASSGLKGLDNTKEKDLDKTRVIELKITRCLILMRKYIDSFETAEVEKHGAGASELVFFKIIIVGNSVQFPVEIYTHETVKELKQKVADEMKTTLEMLRFIKGGKELLEDNFPIRRSSLANAAGQVIHVQRRQTPAQQSNASNLSISISEEEKKWLPNVLLSGDAYFEQFFALLNVLNTQLCGVVWEILEKLPTNQRMKTTFSEIKGDVNWSNLLDTSSVYKLYYSLQILESLMYSTTDENPELQEQWKKNFVAAGGLVHLVQNVMTTNFFETGSNNTKRIQCLALLLRIVNNFIVEKTSNLQTPKFRTEFLTSLKVAPSKLVQKLVDISLEASQPQNMLDTLQPGLISIHQKVTANDKVVSAAVPMIVALATHNIEKSASGPFSEKDMDALSALLTHPSAPKWVETLVFTSPLKLSRDTASLGIFQICKSFKGSSAGRNPTEFFLNQLVRLVPHLKFVPGSKENDYLHTCSEFFRLFEQLVSEATKDLKELSGEYKKLVTELATMVDNHPIVELGGYDAPDDILIGILRVAKSLLAADQAVKRDIGSTLVKVVFNKCLFEIPAIGQQGDYPPRCKTSSSRIAAFDLLLELARGCVENLTILLTELTEYHKKQPYKKQWAYLPQLYDKASSGFVGLKNLGCTCYMNSLMQQLFMHPQFRYKLLSAEDKSPEKSESMLYQMQSIFANLQESARKYYNPEGFTKSYKDEGESMKVGEQMDVDEFCNKLFDKLETLLKNTPQEKILNRFFGGGIVNQIISKECKHRSDREDGFLALPVTVKGKFNLQDALESYVQGETLDGDNKYHCDGCNAKVAALKRECIGKLPNHLIVNLKRIEFDFEEMRRTKVNSLCEFPHKLNLEPYTAEGLARREKVQQASGGEAVLPPPVHPMEFYDYELTGILVHMGTTESGHYYSFIRDPDSKKWFQFNDMNVTPFDPAHIPEQCFGGADLSQQQNNDKRRQVRQLNRSYNAYLLFYERCNPEVPDVDVPIPKSEQSKYVPKVLFDSVWDKNLKFLMDKVLYDKDYTTFVLNLLQLADPKKLAAESAKSDPSDCKPYHLIELGTRFFVQTYAHARDKEKLSDLLTILRNLYANHLPSCRWLLKHLSTDNSWAYQLLLLCPVPSVSEEFSKLLVQAATVIYAAEANLCEEAEALQPTPPTALARPGTAPSAKASSAKGRDDGIYVPSEEASLYNPPIGKSKSVIIQFLETLIKMYPDLHSYWRTYNHFFWVIQEFALIGPRVRRAMVERGFIKVLIHIFMGEESAHFTGKKAVPLKDDAKEKERLKNESLAIANMKHILGAISALIRNVKFPRDPPAAGSSVTPTSPSQLPGDLFECSPQDIELVLSNNFLTRALNEGDLPSAIGELAQHLTWESWAKSQWFIDYLCNLVSKEQSDKFPPYFVVLKMILTMRDSQQDRRLEMAIPMFLGVIDENIRWKYATHECVKFVQDILPHLPKAREIMLAKFSDWVAKWLLYQTRDQGSKLSSDSYSAAESVRKVTEAIIMELVPEVKGYIIQYEKPLVYPSSMTAEAQDHLHLIDLWSRESSQKDAYDENLRVNAAIPQKEVVPQYSASVKERLQFIVRYLWKFLDPASEEYKAAATVDFRSSEGVPSMYFKLASLFRILSWASATPELRKITMEGKNFDNFLAVYKAVDGGQYECDSNRMEICKLWEKITRDCPEVTVAFAESTVAQSAMWHTYIAVKGMKQFFAFNNESLEYFYTVYYRCALASEAYLTGLTKHGNYMWGLQFILLDSPEYPRAARVILQCFDASLKFSPDFKKGWVQQHIINMGLTNFGRCVMNGPAVFTTFARVMQDVPDQVEFCKNNGISHLNSMLAKRDRLTNEGLKTFLASYLRTISWIANKELNEEMAALKNRILASDLRSLSTVVDLLESHFDQKGVLEAVRNLVSFVCNHHPEFRLSILAPSGGAHGILEAEALRRNRINYLQISDDPDKKKHVEFLLDIVKKSVAEDKKSVVTKAVQLLIYCGFEALVLPIDTLLSVLTCLEQIGTASGACQAPLVIPQAVGEYISQVLLTETVFGEFLMELIIHRYNDLSKHGVMVTFFSKFYNKVQDISSNRIFNEILSTLSRQLTNIMSKFKSKSWPKEFQNEIASELTLLFSLLSTIFAQSASKQSYVAPFQKELSDITDLVTSSLAGSSSPQTLSSVDKKLLENLLQLVKSVST